MKEVFEDEVDVFVFIYSSAAEDDTQRMVAMKVNEVAQKFSQMKIKSVKFLSYDSNV